jgi:nitroreductase
MFIDLARTRRSIRRFTDQPVEKEKINQLVEAALRSPSSRGCTPWEFIVVTESDTIARLSRAKSKGAAFLEGAPLAIAICADDKISNVWVEDAAIAATYIHLAASDIGLGSCWIQIRTHRFDESRTSSDRVRELLGLPETLEVLAIMAIGYAAEEKTPHTDSSLKMEKVHYERYDGKR